MNRRHTCATIILGLLLPLAGGCGTETSTLSKAPPELGSLEPQTVAFEDTITVTGSGFNPQPAANSIVVSPGSFDDARARRVIVPFEGSRTQLRGIVPDGVFSGGVRIEDTAPLSAFPLMGPPLRVSSNSVPFGVRLAGGDVGKAFFSGTGYQFSVLAGQATEDYLVVVFSDAVPPENRWEYIYSITARNRTALAGDDSDTSPRGVPGPGGRESAGAGLPVYAPAQDGALERDFKRRVDEETRELLARSGDAPRGGDRGARPSVAAGAPAQTAQFKVLKDATKSVLDVSNYQVITADLRFSGLRMLLYVDATTPPANLTQSEIDNLGQVFDANIYPKNRAAFGVESDINGDGRIAVLMSPAVNRLTPPGSAPSQGYIAGYFLPNDLLPDLVDSRVTNAMEIFYTIVPDPTGQYGNVLSKEKALPVIEAVLAHEFLHMILFNYRVLIHGRGYSGDYMEEIWLNEGLAHIAENVNGYATSNIERANIFLADPGGVTLIHGGDDLGERGAAFLFLRLLGDRFGERVFRSLVQSKKAGVANVEGATGFLFKELFADWSAALYLSGRGITDDPRFNYASIDLRAQYRPLNVITGAISPSGLGGSIRSMAPEYILYGIPVSGAVDFSIGGDASGRFNAVVVRLR